MNIWAPIGIILAWLASGVETQNGAKVYDAKALQQLQSNMVAFQNNPHGFVANQKNELLVRRIYGCNYLTPQSPAENKITCYVMGGGKERGETHYLPENQDNNNLAQAYKSAQQKYPDNKKQ